MSVVTYCLGGSRYGMGIISLQTCNIDRPNWAVYADTHCHLSELFFCLGEAGVGAAAAVTAGLRVAACRNVSSRQARSVSKHSHIMQAT